MSESKHTPGKLMIPVANVFRVIAVDDLGDPVRLILDGCPDGHYGNVLLKWGDDDGPEMAANARRIAATWNACDGISTEALERGVVKDLLAACKASLKLPALSVYAEESSGSHHHSAKKAKEYYDKMNAVLAQIRAAIAAAEGAQ